MALGFSKVVLVGAVAYVVAWLLLRTPVSVRSARLGSIQGDSEGLQGTREDSRP
jgi:hypothetical protein